MSDPDGPAGRGQPTPPGWYPGPGSGYPEPQSRFDPTQPLTGYSATKPPNQTRRPEPPRPRGSRLPLVITLAVLALAVVVVGGATLYAHSKDTEVAAPAPTPSATAAPSGGASTDPSGNATSTAFTTDEGAGTMKIAAHVWTTGGDPPPTNGTYLEIDFELASTQGTVTVTPSLFQAFDAKGELFQSSTATRHQPALTDTQLSEGETTQGWLSYDIPRGDVTVLLGDSFGQPIAALKVKG